LTGEAQVRRALALEPARHAAMQALYGGRYRSGRHGETLAACRRAVALDPGNADDRCNLGEILVRLERRGDGLRHLAEALALDPQFGEVFHKIGVSRQVLGDFDGALVCYSRALALLPASSELQLLRLSAIIAAGPGQDTPARYRQLLAMPARTPEELLVRGSALDGLGRHAEAIASQCQALALKPDAFDSWHHRAGSLAMMGRLSEAVRDVRRTLAISPDYGSAHSNLIFWLDFMPGFDFAAHQAERRRWARRHRPAGPPQAHANSRDPQRMLRLGYVSSDFKRHSAADIFGPVIRRHDRNRFELYLYSGVYREDERTHSFRAAATVWRSTLGMSAEALAARIRADAIDILIDLSGHTGGNHLPTFVRKPAPVQVTAWGHGTGTGLPEMDWFFADPVLVPPEARPLFAEQVYDLPCFITCELPEGMPPVEPLPAATTGQVTFGCFNRASKMTAATLEVWARLLAQVPPTRLLLKDRTFDDAGARRRFADAFASRGVAPERLRFLGTTSRGDHLVAHGQVDIALDPFPANGGVSTCEALIMGVPVVGLLGRSAPSRSGASLLSAAGCADWVARDADEYIRIAASWAGRIDALSRLRPALRRRYLASPVGDAPTYTRAAEAAFRDIWRRWCAAPISTVARRPEPARPVL
jgi:predicted O-linked N-acetylglucosamine transferase (SPINDLY family)